MNFDISGSINFENSSVQYAAEKKLTDVPHTFEAIVKLPKNLEGNGGLGMAMVLTFHEDSNEVNVNWISTDSGKLYRERNQFTIELQHVTSAPEVNTVLTTDDATYRVTSIAANAFENNRNIKEVTIGDNVKVIGLRAFANCIYLKKVTMGKSVSVLVYKAFYNCVSRTDLTMPDNEMKTGEYAFYGCKYLKKIKYYQTDSSVE